MRNFKFFSGFLCIFLIALTAGKTCAALGPPNASFEANLSLSPEPLVGVESDLTLTVNSLINAPNTHIVIDIPSGVEIINGSTDFFLDMTQGEIYTHTVTIRILEQGRYNFLTSVQTGVVTEGYAHGEIGEIHIISTDTIASIYQEVDQEFYETEEYTIQGDTIIKTITPDESMLARIQHTLTSTITVSGVIKYKNKDTQEYISFPHVKVQVENIVAICWDCWVGGCGAACPPLFRGWCMGFLGVPCAEFFPNPFIKVIETDYTDDDGYYSISGLPSGENYRVSVLMDNGVAYIDNDSDGRFPETNDKLRVSSDITLDLYIDYSEPARILHNLYKANNWCSDKLGWTRGKVKVNYYHNGTGVGEFSMLDYINYYQKVGVIDALWFDFGRSNIAHEYGHAVMYKAYGDDLPVGDGPDPHDINSVSDYGFALSEGWADFFSQAVYITESINEYNADYWLLENLEDQANAKGCPYWQGENCDNQAGDDVEGAVASFLWDLYDSPETLDDTPGEDEDDAHGLADAMWHVFKDGVLGGLPGNYHAQTISEFWCIWSDVDPPQASIVHHAPGPQSIDTVFEINLRGLPSPRPEIPINLTATPTPFDCWGIELNWTDNSTNESGFKIYRRIGASSDQIGTVSEGITSYFDWPLSCNTTYEYRIKAYNDWGNSDYSDLASTTTLQCQPTAPSNLVAYGISSSQIRLTWTDNSTDEAGFRVDRVIGSVMLPIAYLPANYTSFIDGNLGCDATYLYRVSSYTAPGCPSYSYSAYGTTHSCPGCPFVYVWNGEKFVNDNVILTGSEDDSNDKFSLTDYYILSQTIEPKDGKYELEIREYENEISRIDHLSLSAIDYPADEKIAVTPDGKVWIYSDALSPVSCVDQDGNDHLAAITAEDKKHFSSTKPGYLIVNFGKLDKGGFSKPLHQLSGGGGTPIDPPDKTPAKLSPPKGESKGNIIYVDVVDKNGQWKNAAKVYPKTRSVPSLVELSGYVKPEEDFKIKISWVQSYSADHIAYYRFDDSQLTITELTLSSATHSEEGYINTLLDNSDDQKVSLSPDQTVNLSFTALPDDSSKKRSFLLLVKGYYETLETTPQLDSLASLNTSTPTMNQNYPNPFNQMTGISFTLPYATKVTLNVYNVLGRKVATLVDEEKSAGTHNVSWDGKDSNGIEVASGIYFYRIKAGQYSEVRKMLLVK